LRAVAKGMATPQFPYWLHALSIVSLILGLACAIVIAIHQRSHPPKMAVMQWVWPLAALFGSVIWLALHFRAQRADEDVPMWLSVAKGASHCGAGCTLGDIIAEWLAFAFPAIAVWLGWHTVFPEKTFAVWILDYVLAFGIGIAFQYWAIVPMRDLSFGKGVTEAVKADFLSIGAWQVGMYGLMAAGQFLWFRPAYGDIAEVASPEFWFLMQIAMLGGFVTAYPVNWWLVRAGIKERM